MQKRVVRKFMNAMSTASGTSATIQLKGTA